MLTQFWAMTSFLKVLTQAKNTDSHCWSGVMQYFECMVPKTFYSCFLCLRNKKVINFQIFPTLVQEKYWSQQKLWYLAKNVVVIWYRIVWSIFMHNLVTIEQKIKKWWRGGEGPMDAPPPQPIKPLETPTLVGLIGKKSRKSTLRQYSVLGYT